MTDRQAYERSILDKHLKGISVRILWQAFAGWTSIIVTLLAIYFSLKAQIHDGTLEQARTDAIQDMRLDAMKRDIDLQSLQIKDLNERFNELNSQK